MSKKLTVQLELADKVEALMLKGLSKPAQVIRSISEITDFKVAEIYIKAIKNKWSKKSVDLEAERVELIEATRASQVELESRAGSATEDNIFSLLKSSARREREERKKLLGLDEQRVIIGKDQNPLDGLSEEQVQAKMLELLPDNIIQKEYARRFPKTIPSNVEEGVVKEH